MPEAKREGGGLGCALVFGGIFLAVALILGAVGFFADAPVAYNYKTGQSGSVRGTLLVLAAVFGGLGLGVVALGFILGRPRS